MKHITVGKKTLPYKDSKFQLSIFMEVNDDETCRVTLSALDDPFILMRIAGAFNTPELLPLLSTISHRKRLETKPSGRKETWHEMILNDCALEESRITGIIDDVFDACKPEMSLREKCDRICHESGLEVERWFYTYTVATRIYAKSEYFVFRELKEDFNTDVFSPDSIYQAVVSLKCQISDYLKERIADEISGKATFDQEAKMEVDSFLGQISVAEEKLLNLTFTRY